MMISDQVRLSGHFWFLIKEREHLSQDSGPLALRYLMLISLVRLSSLIRNEFIQATSRHTWIHQLSLNKL